MLPNLNPNKLLSISFKSTAGPVIVIVLGLAFSLTGTGASAEELMKLGLDDVSTLGLTITF